MNQQNTETRRLFSSEFPPSKCERKIYEYLLYSIGKKINFENQKSPFCLSSIEDKA